MKQDERRRLRLNLEKYTVEYPSGLEKFFPVDEKAIRLLDLEDGGVDANVEKYFMEQMAVKEHVKYLYEQLTKEMNSYQENARKLIEYIKGLNL